MRNEIPSGTGSCKFQCKDWGWGAPQLSEEAKVPDLVPAAKPPKPAITSDSVVSAPSLGAARNEPLSVICLGWCARRSPFLSATTPFFLSPE